MKGWAWPVLALVGGTLASAALAAPGLSPFAQLVVSNLLQLGAAAAASILCLLASRNPVFGNPAAWRWLGAGTGAWAVGQLIWTWYEVRGTEVPFPSAADLGFLLFPVGATVGLVAWLGGQANVVARGRDLLDGAIIAVSLLVLSWITVLDNTLEVTTESLTAVVLSVAYPLGDVVLGTLALLALARADRRERAVLASVTGGLAFLALADSAYLYLVAQGAYASADLISSGWVYGFLLLASAALADLRDPERELSARSPVRVVDGQIGILGWVLPYLPFSAAGAAVLWSLATDPENAVVSSFLSVALVVLVLARQSLAMVENRRLYAALGVARDELAYQALHDPLTGLANRALFADRLDHALRRPVVALGLLYCDLDDFKQVNDRFGHTAGDAVLVEVARRLLSCVRTSDTVARLGGDEFAILLEDAEDTQAVTDRVITAMLEPFTVGDTALGLSVSVGVARHAAAEGGQRSADLVGAPGSGTARDTAVEPVVSGPGAEPTVEEIAGQLLQRADVAMYAAKSAGKGRAVEAPGNDDAADPMGGGV